MSNRLTGYRPAVRRSTALAIGFTIGLSSATTSGAAIWSVALASSRSGGPAAAAPFAQCVSAVRANDDLARRMAQDIDRALSGRGSAVGLDVTDDKTGITCQFHSGWHFVSASVVKVTILAALLHKLAAQHKKMSAQQRSLTWLMITQSDNNAASALWNEVGRASLQRFLRLAGMRSTVLGPGGAWGLTLITPRNEVLLLKLITGPNTVLNQSARIYARYLMAHVIPSQRWGVPAGAPASVQVHVKNGWLPYPSGSDWRINSIGAFTTVKRVYLMAILTENNPSMAYGIETIEGAAVAIHRDLNPGRHKRVPRSAVSPAWGIPDESVPPRLPGASGALVPAH